MKIVSILILWAQILPLSAQNIHQLKLILEASNQAQATQRQFYLAGNFNQWNPKDSSSEFYLQSNKKWVCNLNLRSGNYQFKITKGSWGSVECFADGSSIQNHEINLLKDTTIIIRPEAFSDEVTLKEIQHTLSAQVHILDSTFYMPQLHRYRRIWIYLPKDYQNVARKYPVIYMQDGQNLFDKATSSYGEWGVDEVLDSLSLKNVAESIIVGIDHGGEFRLNEYHPYDNDRFGKGQGDAYVDFVVQTLKPYVDKNFRTLAQAKYTSIVGSSMGGLISMYAIAKYPNVFGNAGVFSPSFWIAPKLYDFVHQQKNYQLRIYFVAGAHESEDMAGDMEKMYQLLLKDGLPKENMKLAIKADGKHSEWFWHREFPDFYKWLVKIYPAE
ncbi:MAG: alpha/beta hydrolase [Sphingobacteriales bacterium]|nr:alpha/beta hydrolase [Sphingobacteriales bacterium]